MTLQKQSTFLANLQNDNLSPIQLVELASELLPKGNPDFMAVKYYKPIKLLLEQEMASLTDIRCALLTLVKNFSESMNVVRNLNETQAIEITEMLIDECGDFRIEDYFIMFQMAKRGKIGDIRDRIDIQLVSKLIDEYWEIRHKEGKKLAEIEDKLKYEERQEQKRKMLGSGESETTTISKEDFKLMLQNLENSIKENLEKYTLDEVKQLEIKKEMAVNRMREAFGITDAQIAEMKEIKFKTFGSKINDKQ